MAVVLGNRRASFALAAVIMAGAFLSLSEGLIDLQVGLNGANLTNVTNTIIGDLIEETVTLSCAGANGSLEYADLEWVDGEFPVRESLGNREMYREGSMVFLRIRNFAVDNYGQYRCRCVNDYSRLALFTPNETLTLNAVLERTYADFCSIAEHTINLLPTGHSMTETVEPRLITEVGQMVPLTCASGNWSVWRAQSPPQNLQNHRALDITVSKSTDQAKAVCHGVDNMLDRIFYISIQDYHQIPPKFIRPSGTSTREIVVDFNTTDFTVLCMLQYSQRARLYMSRNEGKSVFINDAFDGILIGGSYPDTPLQHLYIFNSNFAERIAPKHVADMWYNSTFSCRTEGMVWDEDVEMEFRLLKPAASRDTAPLPSSALISYPTSTTPLSTTLSTIAESVSSIDSVYSSDITLSTTSSLASPSLTSSPAPFVPSPGTAPSPPMLATNHFTIAPTVSSPLMTSSASLTTKPLLSSLATSRSSNTILLVSIGLMALMVFLIVNLCVIFICFKKCCNLTHQHSVAGLTAKDLFLEFGITDSENGSQEGVSTRFSATNLFLYSKSLAKCISELERNQWLFPYEQLELKEELGSGAFGLVKKAAVHNVRPDGSSITVAVKMLKEDASNEEERDLISELKVLQHVGAHPNIVSFLGAAIHQAKLHLIVEFCGNGSLLEYLRSKRCDREDPLMPKSQIAMAHQVALGMKYLASKKCIHRDLAARNVLVTEDLVFKVADFGLARKVYDSIYRPSGGRVPIKWMSPETILDREYTTQSDVWSFGVLLWEILSLGRSPYPGRSPEEVIKCIGEGYRMPAPDGCPLECYSLMLKCWDRIPTRRPSFTDLCGITQELGVQLEVLESNHHNPHHMKNSSLNISTPRDLCYYCTQEVGGAKYCCCSCTSLDGDPHDYMNVRAQAETRTSWHIVGSGVESIRTSGNPISQPGDSPAVSWESSKRLPRMQQSPSARQHSSSMPYLPILRASAECLSLMDTVSPQRHIVCTGGRYDRLLPSKDSRESSYHQVNPPAPGYNRLKAKSATIICNCEYEEDCSSLNAVPKDTQDLWSKGIPVAGHRALKTSRVPQEKMKLEHQHSSASNDSGMETSLLPHEHTHPNSVVCVVAKAKVEHQQSNVSNDSGVVTYHSTSLWSLKSSLSEAMEVGLEEDAVIEDPFSN